MRVPLCSPILKFCYSSPKDAFLYLVQVPPSPVGSFLSENSDAADRNILNHYPEQKLNQFATVRVLGN